MHRFCRGRGPRGLLFTPAEMAEFAEAFQEAGIEGFTTQTAKKVEM